MREGASRDLPHFASVCLLPQACNRDKERNIINSGTKHSHPRDNLAAWEGSDKSQRTGASGLQGRSKWRKTSQRSGRPTLVLFCGNGSVAPAVSALPAAKPSHLPAACHDAAIEALGHHLGRRFPALLQGLVVEESDNRIPCTCSCRRYK